MPAALHSVLFPDVTVLGLCGHAGAGKDTAAGYLADRYGFLQISLAQPLADMLAALLEHVEVDHSVMHERHLKERPLPELLQLSPRHLKQALGDWGRALDPDLWLHVMRRRLGLFGGGSPVHDRIVISDVRFCNEAAFVRRGHGSLVQLYRPNLAPVRSHISESEQDSDAFRTMVTHRINNDGSVWLLRERLDQLCIAQGWEQRDPVGF